MQQNIPSVLEFFPFKSLHFHRSTIHCPSQASADASLPSSTTYQNCPQTRLSNTLTISPHLLWSMRFITSPYQSQVLQCSPGIRFLCSSSLPVPSVCNYPRAEQGIYWWATPTLSLLPPETSVLAHLLFQLPFVSKSPGWGRI